MVGLQGQTSERSGVEMDLGVIGLQMTFGEGMVELTEEERAGKEMRPKTSLEEFPQLGARRRRMGLHRRQKEWPEATGRKPGRSVVSTMDRTLQKQGDAPSVLRKISQHVHPSAQSFPSVCSFIHSFIHPFPLWGYSWLLVYPILGYSHCRAIRTILQRGVRNNGTRETTVN